MKTLSALASGVINLIYPRLCASCTKKLAHDNSSGLCRFCIGAIRKNPKPWCIRCGRALTNAKAVCPDCRGNDIFFNRAYSAFLYEGPLKDAVCSFKYKERAYFSKLFSHLLTDFINANTEIISGIDAVSFVPLHWRRARNKGFNHSKVLANIISKEYDIKLLDILIKTRPSRQQNELTRDERFTNLTGAFKVRDDQDICGLALLLVDDVMTTGSTLNECAKTLKNRGAREVRCLTLSRGM